ncbi:MAG: 50S ribosomal protein L6 [Candidatus Micrarchaeota archaeon]
MAEFEQPIPAGAQIKIQGNEITAAGKLGELKRKFALAGVKIEVTDKLVRVSMEKPTVKQKACLGSIAAHIKNMAFGVANGHTYEMKAVYKHFPINVSIEGGKVMIKNFCGEKKPRAAKIVGKSTKVELKGEKITITSPSIEEAGQTAGNIEQATRIRGRDIRIFQDGIFITKKAMC